MKQPDLNDEKIAELLRDAKTIAVVGASPSAERDSNAIMLYLAKIGYDVIPVNPNYEEIAGMKCYPTVTAAGRTVDIVDVFRRSEFVEEVAADAVAAKAGTLWMQLGVINEAARDFASDNGLNVVMNKCIMVEHRRLIR
ncbi:MAG TPA: CoA-binding protein [Candidatus Kryptonia bacterium]